MMAVLFGKAGLANFIYKQTILACIYDKWCAGSQLLQAVMPSPRLCVVPADCQVTDTFFTVALLGCQVVYILLSLSICTRG